MDILKNNASLLKIYRVKSKFWVSSVTNASGGPVRNIHITFKGKYYWRDKDCIDKIKATVVVMQWAKEDLSVVVLAYVQTFAYSMTKPEICNNDPDYLISN